MLGDPMHLRILLEEWKIPVFIDPCFVPGTELGMVHIISCKSDSIGYDTMHFCFYFPGEDPHLE